MNYSINDLNEKYGDDLFNFPNLQLFLSFYAITAFISVIIISFLII